MTLSGLRRASRRTLVVRLKLPDGQDFAYRPGQFIGLEAHDGRPRFFSIANAEPIGDELELHVSRAPGGLLTGALFETARPGDRFWLVGPFGEFFIPPDASPHTIVVAGGTGFAPIKACLERMAAVRAGRDGDRPLHFYWGARSLEDLYDIGAVDALMERLPGVRFTPVLDQGHPDCATRTGHVHRAVVEDFDDLSDYDIYACGAPAMIEALGRECAAQRGFDPTRLVADVFSVGPSAGYPGRVNGDGPINLYLDRTVRPCAIPGVAGEALMFALKRSGVPLPAVCGGQGACGTCLVHVAPAWRKRTGQPARREERLLRYLGVGEGDRLSCQIPLTADLDGLELHTCVETKGESP
ncbi:MAG TPA: flavin reductase family protein [Polyangia bacterium]|nr:flavin reductase family protein [Polyangia bacterium]